MHTKCYISTVTSLTGTFRSYSGNREENERGCFPGDMPQLMVDRPLALQMYLSFLQEPEPQSIFQWVIVVSFSRRSSPSQPDIPGDPADTDSWCKSAALRAIGLARVLGHGLVVLAIEDVSL